MESEDKDDKEAAAGPDIATDTPAATDHPPLPEVLFLPLLFVNGFSLLSCIPPFCSGLWPIL